MDGIIIPDFPCHINSQALVHSAFFQYNSSYQPQVGHPRRKEVNRMDHLRTVVERITYQNAENGYSVLLLRAKGYNDLISIRKDSLQ